jgi:2'-5' RNA ligase
MLHLAVCSFLEPQAEGTEFAASAIPVHVTLLGNFRVECELPDVVRAIRASAGRLPVEAVTAEPARFGAAADIPVTLVGPTPELLAMHEALLDALHRLGAIADEPQYTGAGFRPHITWAGGTPVEPEQRYLLESVSVVDLAPGGNDHERRVVATTGEIIP